MDRREALKALVSLPATTRISVAQLKPDDVIVIECEERFSRQELANIHTVAQRVWPGRKVVIMPGGLKLKVVAGA